MKLKVIVHEAEEGGYWAEVPAIPGCVTRQMERLSTLPKPKQRAVMEVLESMLAQAAREEART
jgi:predicted RNase H-like HicB family nuclease